MRFTILLITILIFCYPVTAFGQSKLEGRVVKVSGGIASNYRMISPGGQAARTDSNSGHFLIIFTSLEPGLSIQIKVNSPQGWKVCEPIFGIDTAQNMNNLEPHEVVIAPIGSPLLKGPTYIRKLLGNMTRELAEQKRENANLVANANLNADESQRTKTITAILDKYAKEYGFTKAEVLTAVQSWVQPKITDDKEARALKEFWNYHYTIAGQLALESAIEADDALVQDRQKRLEDGRNSIRKFKLAGDSYAQGSEWERAKQAYQALEQRFANRLIAQEDFREAWAENEASLGNTKRNLAAGVKRDERKRLLTEALAELCQAATVYPREQSPQKWAEMEWYIGNVLVKLGEVTSGTEGLKYLNDAVTALNAALEVRTYELSKEDWALTQISLGITFDALGRHTSGEESFKYLNDAVKAYKAALVVIKREESQQDWAVAQDDLCVALIGLGLRTSGAESLKYLNEAATACQGASEIDKAYPKDWAFTQNNLGVALMRIGERMRGEERLKYLNDAVKAFNAALEYRTRVDETLGQWALTQTNLARAYFLLEDWARASEAYTNVLQVEPDNREAYIELALLYQNRIFKFDEAFALNQQWLAHHTDDVVAQGDFAETHFTTSRFSECGQRIAVLLSNQEVPADDKTSLRAIEIASLLGNNQPKQVPAKLDVLIKEVASQSAEFKVRWVFDGTRHFIDQNEKLSPYRAWLGQLFDALENKDRDTMLRALQEVRTIFKE